MSSVPKQHARKLISSHAKRGIVACSDTKGRLKQTDFLENRLAAEAVPLREQAATILYGPEREEVLRRARQAETGAHMSDWRRSPGLRTPTAFTDLASAKRFPDKAAEALQRWLNGG